MRLIALLVLPVLALFALALVLIFIPLPGPLPEAGSQGRNLLAAVCVGVLGVVYVLGITAYSVASFTGRGKALEAELVRSGLAAEGYVVFGRVYRGRLDDRPVEVRVMPALPLKPSLVEVTLAARPRLRAAVGRTRPLLDCRDCAEVDRIAPQPSRLRVFAEDAALARASLADAETWALVETTVAGGGADGSAELYIQETRLWLRWHPWTVEAGGIDARMQSLRELARRLES